MIYTGILNAAQTEFLIENNIYSTFKRVPKAKARFVRRRVVVPHDVVVEPYCAFAGAGRHFFSMGAQSYSRSPFRSIRIGRFCSIATLVAVMPPNHPLTRLSTSGFDYANYPIYRDFLTSRGASMPRTPVEGGHKPPPAIGHDVWVGMGALLARGVTVGHGAVIGARAIVTKDVPPYAIVAGSPARIIRYRFDEAMIERLLAIQWWNHDPAAFADLDTIQPQRFLDQFEDRKARDGIPAYQPRQIRLAAELARLDPTFSGEIV